MSINKYLITDYFKNYKGLDMSQFILILVILLSLGCTSTSKKASPLNAKPSILQSLTTEHMAQFTVVRHKNQQFKYSFEPNIQHHVTTKSFRTSEWLVDHLTVTNLNLSNKYNLVVKNKANIEIDRRVFKAFDPKKLNLKISIASCMDDRFTKEQKSMWLQFIRQKSDLHFFIGDNVYGDVNVKQKGMATPDELWQRYIDTRLSLEIYKTKNLTPTLATWDDHDYGNNGGGINYPHKKESQEIFNIFFTPKTHLSKFFHKGPGVSFMYSVGGQNYYFLDNRSFRTNKKAKVDFHLGELQEEWLFNLLKKKNEFSWLINGNQFFGGYQRFESFEKNHPNNFKNFIKKLKDIKTKVGFISGDRHLFEVMEIKKPDLNYSTIELTTSAIHAKVYPSSWRENPNPRQLFGAAGKHNFATLNTTTVPGGVDIKLNGYGPNSKPLFLLNKKIR